MSARHLENCPVCSSAWKPKRQIQISDFETYDVVLGPPLRRRLDLLTHAECPSCGSAIATDSRGSVPGLMDSLYRDLPEEYWGTLHSSEVALGRRLERLLETVPSQGDLWDVGCGSGAMLEQLDSRWKKHGIEPGRVAVAEARRRGLDVRQGTASSLGLEGVADGAIALDVLEHLVEPLIEVQAIYRMLRPGGVFVALTGARDRVIPTVAGRLWYYYFCVGHVTVFSRRGLRKLLEHGGFERVQSRTARHPGQASVAKWLRRWAGNALRRLGGRESAPLPLLWDHQWAFGRRPSTQR